LNGHAGNRKLTNVEGALTAWMRDEGAVLSSQIPGFDPLNTANCLAETV
jgi:hypothetical protein